MFPRANTQSTILYRITMGAVVASAPTVGSNSEIYDYKGVRFGLVDLGGQSSLRSAWSQYFADTAAIILVIDSNDSARLGLAKAELQKLVKNEVSRGRRADAERSEARREAFKASADMATIRDAVTQRPADHAQLFGRDVPDTHRSSNPPSSSCSRTSKTCPNKPGD